MPIREEAIPVVRDGRALAVLTRHTNLATLRTPSRLELTYLATRRRPGPDDRRGGLPDRRCADRASGGARRGWATG